MVMLRIYDHLPYLHRIYLPTLPTYLCYRETDLPGSSRETHSPGRRIQIQGSFALSLSDRLYAKTFNKITIKTISLIINHLHKILLNNEK